MIEENVISPLRQEVIDFIEMSDTGDYASDCAKGRRFAEKLVDRMAQTDNTAMLGAVCRGIVDAGRWQAVHAGFFQRLADRCVIQSV